MSDTCPCREALERIADVEPSFATWSTIGLYARKALAEPCGCEKLEAAVRHVIADSPGTPESVKGYLRSALSESYCGREAKKPRRRKLVKADVIDGKIVAVPEDDPRRSESKPETQLFGIPIRVDESMPPGTLELRDESALSEGAESGSTAPPSSESASAIGSSASGFTHSYLSTSKPTSGVWLSEEEADSIIVAMRFGVSASRFDELLALLRERSTR